jgi:hypothetical protein
LAGVPSLDEAALLAIRQSKTILARFQKLNAAMIFRRRTSKSECSCSLRLRLFRELRDPIPALEIEVMLSRRKLAPHAEFVPAASNARGPGKKIEENKLL